MLISIRNKYTFCLSKDDPSPIISPNGESTCEKYNGIVKKIAKSEYI